MNKVWDSSGLVNGNADVVRDVGHREVADYTTALRFLARRRESERPWGLPGLDVGC